MRLPTIPPSAAAALAAVVLAHSPMSAPMRAIATPEPESALVAELLKRTERNKEANAAAVKRITEQNAYTAVSGDIKKLVTAQDGSNIYLSDGQIFELTRQGRLFCGIGVPCRIVDTPGREEVSLPTPKRLQCDPGGRNCIFQEIPVTLVPALQQPAAAALASVKGDAAEQRLYTDYVTLKQAVESRQVEGVVFQQPRGDIAFALVDGQSVHVDVAAGWKKAELKAILARLSVPNNLNEFTTR